MEEFYDGRWSGEPVPSQKLNWDITCIRNGEGKELIVLPNNYKNGVFPPNNDFRLVKQSLVSLEGIYTNNLLDLDFGSKGYVDLVVDPNIFPFQKWETLTVHTVKNDEKLRLRVFHNEGLEVLNEVKSCAVGTPQLQWDISGLNIGLEEVTFRLESEQPDTSIKLIAVGFDINPPDKPAFTMPVLPGAITGTIPVVFNVKNGLGGVINGAIVDAGSPNSGVTNSSGTVTLNLKQGVYLITVSEANYGTETYELIVNTNTPVQNVVLESPYELTGLSNVIITPAGQGSIVDLVMNGDYYKTVARSTTVTINPADTGGQVGSIGVGAGAGTYAFAIGKPNPTSELKSIELSGNAAVASGGVISVGYRVVNSSGSTDRWIGSRSDSNGGNIYINGSENPAVLTGQAPHTYYALINFSKTTTGGNLNVSRASWTPYQSTQWGTNATYRSLNTPIESNTAELVIENNKQVISSCTLFSSTNTNLGALITNQNVKFATVNNRAGSSYNFDLKTSAISGTNGVDWFTKLFIKNIYNSLKLSNVTYEVDMQVNHSLTSSQVNTAVTNDNNNRNVHRQRFVITDIPWNDSKLSKRVNSNYSNVRIVEKTSKTLLNHSFDSTGKLTVELPVKLLKASNFTLTLVFLSKTHSYAGLTVDSALPSLPVTSINYTYS